MKIDTFNNECQALADWWLQYAQDTRNGGFYGQVSFDNQPVETADKCIILNTRILWFFSEAARFYQSADYALAADRAFAYLCNAFHDKKHEGFYWSVSAEGQLQDSRKHTYAQAFTIYALAAYFDLRGDASALNLALTCFDKLETVARDQVLGGYLEAFTEDWQPLQDVRLSHKEDNHPKTMNTHLHVLEAYTGLNDTLLRAGQPVEKVTAALASVLQVLCEKIVDKTRGHVKMFLTDDWQDQSTAYSFGHDIEASWLTRKAVKSLTAAGYDASRFNDYADVLARRSLTDGLQPSGRMLDEVEIASGHRSPTAWWVQFEALVGFAYWQQAGGDDELIQTIESIWSYTCREFRNNEYGEWNWFGKSDLLESDSEYKTGAWKAPYHTGRALMELAQIFGNKK